MLCGLPKQGGSTAKARQADGARGAHAPAGMRSSVALSSTEARSVAHPAMPRPVCHHADPHARHGALARPGRRGRGVGPGPRAAPDLVRDLAAEEVRVLLAQRVEVERDLGIHAAADVVVQRPGALRAPRARARATPLSSLPPYASPARASSLLHHHTRTPRGSSLSHRFHLFHRCKPRLLFVTANGNCRQHPGAPQVHHRSSAGRRRHCSTASTVPAAQARRWLSRAVTRHGHLLVLAAAQRPRLTCPARGARRPHRLFGLVAVARLGVAGAAALARVALPLGRLGVRRRDLFTRAAAFSAACAGGGTSGRN